MKKEVSNTQEHLKQIFDSTFVLGGKSDSISNNQEGIIDISNLRASKIEGR